MKILNKLFTYVLESGVQDIGESGTAISITDISHKINTITLTDDCTVALPEFDSETSVTFMFKVTQDTTGGHNLTINKADGTEAVNLSEFDFTSGTASQRTWVTVLWDGTDVVFTASNYVD